MKWMDEFWQAGTRDHKCFIAYNPLNGGLDIRFVHYPHLSDSHFLGHVNSDDRLEYTDEIQPGLYSERCTLSLGVEETNALLGAVMEFVKDRDIKTSNSSFNEGKIEAMTNHLEDMRKLVFEPRESTDH